MIQIERFKNVVELLDHFKDEETCKLYLENQRWDGHVCCPKCGHDKVYRTNAGFKCASPKCYKKFTVTVGTYMESSKIKLRIWLAATYLLTAHKKGISSYQLARDLGVCQKTAWFLNHRIRAMFESKTNRKFTTVCEADESFIGGKNKNRHKDKKVKNSQGRSFKDKTPVMGILEREGEIRVFKVANTEIESLQPMLEQHIEEGTPLMTDEWSGYNNAGVKFHHQIVRHSAKEYVNGMVHTNGCENFWSLLKRGYVGIYHQMSRKHLDRYCLEFSFRFNSRNLTDQERFHKTLTLTTGRLKWNQLVNAA